MASPRARLDALRADGGREDVASLELESEIAKSQRKHRARARARTMSETVADSSAAALRPVLCCACVSAYVAAQCNVRKLGAVAECWQPLLEQHTSVVLSGPMVLWHAVLQSFSPEAASPQTVLPTPQEALNALGCTVGVLLAHELLRRMFVWLVWYSRRSTTSWDDVLFGCGARFWPHVPHHFQTDEVVLRVYRTGDVPRCARPL